MDKLNERTQENSQPVLESLFELWIDKDPAYDGGVRQLFGQLGEWLDQMRMEESDRITGIVVELCIAYARKGFLDGARMAGHLIREMMLEE